jgi:replicative DNA helicase
MRESKESERQKIYINASAISDRVNPDAAKNLRSARAEEAIIGLLLNRREYLAKIKRGEVELKTDNFYTALGQKLFALIMENSADDGEIFEGAFGEALSDEEMGRLTRLRIMRDGLKNDETVFYDCIQTLKESKEEKSLEDIINEKRKREGN